MTTSSINTHRFTAQQASDTHSGNHDTGSFLQTLAAAGGAVIRRIGLMYDVYGERRQMQRLSDDMLNDLGITRAQLNEECSRSLTDVPANRSVAP